MCVVEELRTNNKLMALAQLISITARVFFKYVN